MNDDVVPTFRAYLQPHPLRPEIIEADVETGVCLSELGAGTDVAVWVNGIREANLLYRPLPGDSVVLRRIVHGGDGAKEALYVVAAVAIAVAAPYVGAALGGGVAGAAGSIAFTVGSTLALNALIPPPDIGLDLDRDTPRGVTSNSNRALPFGAIPRIYGTRRLFPPLAASPFSDTEGKDQYVSMLFCLGYGPQTIDEASIRLGETLLSDYEDKKVESFAGTGVAQTSTIYTRAVSEVGLSDLFDLDNDTATRTTAANVREFSLDLLAPALVRFNNEGKKRWVRVGFTIEARPAGGGAWTQVRPSGTAYVGNVAGEGDAEFGVPIKDAMDVPVGNLWSLFGRESRGHYATIRVVPPSVGQYDVRVTRQIMEAENVGNQVEPQDNILSEFTWTALRGFGAEGAQILDPDLAYIALRIKATGQLNSGIQNLSVETSAHVPVWNGSTWVVQASSNPAYIFRDILTGNANPRPLPTGDMLDSDIIAWAGECNTAGREFNGVFDSTTTVDEAVRAVAFAGRGARQIRDGKYTAVRDKPGLPVTQLFTPRNSWNFNGVRVFQDHPHAFRVQFDNREDDWNSGELVVYADGYSEDGAGETDVATRFESVTMFGITDADHAWKEARYMMAVAKLRPETFTWEVFTESLVTQRGDVVRFQNDSALIGLGAGRITALGGGSITGDETFTIESGKTYAVRIRKDEGTTVQATVTTGVGVTNTLALSGGVPAGVKVGDLFAFGESTKITFDLLVTGVAPGSDLKARITAVPYSSPAVHNADTGEIPPYDPGITRPAETPPAPVIVDVSPRFVRSDAGPRVPRISIQYRIPASAVPVARVELGYRETDVLSFTGDGTRQAIGQATIAVEDGSQNYVVRIRSISATGVPSAWSEAEAIFVAEETGDLTTITLQEFVNSPETVNGDQSTILITVTPPDPIGNYRHALVQRKRPAATGWRNVGVTDENGQATDVRESNGRTFQYRARASYDSGFLADDGPVAEITLSDAKNGPTAPGGTPFAELNIANVRVLGRPTLLSDTWLGPDFTLTWDAPASLPAGHTLRDYIVQIIDPTTDDLMLQVARKLRRCRYVRSRNEEDAQDLGYDDALRALDVRVYARTDQRGVSAAPGERSISNPAPELPETYTLLGLLDGFRLRFRRPQDRDYRITRVYASTSMGFTPGDANLVYENPDTNPINVLGLTVGTWYVRVQCEDDFGLGPMSDELSVVVGAIAAGDPDTTAPPVPADLALSFIVDGAGQDTRTSLVATCGTVVDPEGSPVRYEFEVWRTADPDNTVRNQTRRIERATFAARANQNYTARVRSLDRADNASAWSSTVALTTGDDTTAPANVTDFAATVRIGRFVLRWVEPADADYNKVDIHRGTSAGFTPDTGAASATRVTQSRNSKFADTEVTTGVSYYYKTRTLDRAGNASTFATWGPFGIVSDEQPKDVTAPPVPTGLAITSVVISAGQVTDVNLRTTCSTVVDPEGSGVRYEFELTRVTAPVGTARVRMSKIAEHTFASIRAGIEYQARVRSVDEFGNASAWSSAVNHTAAGDSTAPANTTGLSLVARVGRIVVKWTNPGDNDLDRVELQRATDSGFTAGVTTVFSGRANRYLDSEVTAGTTYWYRTRTYDISGNTAGYGSSANVAPLGNDLAADTEAPPTPAGLAFASVVEDSAQTANITLRATWGSVTDPQGTNVRYELQLWPTSDATRIRTRGTKELSHIFESVHTGRSYTGRVRAIDEFGNASAWSSTVAHTVTADAVAPANTTGLALVARVGAILAKWTNPTDADFQRVELQRATDSGFTAGVTTVFSGVATRYVDREVNAGTTYWYRTRTYDVAGNTAGYGSSANTAPTANDVTADTTAPTVPTGFALASTAEGADLTQDVTIRASWTASTDSDGNPITYEVDLWPTSDATRIRTRRTRQTAVIFERVLAGVGYTGRVRAVDSWGNASAYTSTVAHTAATSSAAIANVTGASVTAGLFKNVASWTNPTGANFLEVELHRGTSSGFTASGSTLIYKGRGTLFIDDTGTIGTAYWYRTRTLSSNGTNSGYSAAFGSATPFTVNSGNIGTYFASAAIGNAYISDLDAVKITAGTINAARIGAGTITADKLNVSTLSAITANLGTVTAGSVFSGTFSTNVSGSTGKRIMLANANELLSYDSNNTLGASIGYSSDAGGATYVHGGPYWVSTPPTLNVTQQGRTGVGGWSVIGNGVYGQSQSGNGVRGEATGTGYGGFFTGGPIGVYGISTNAITGIGVYGISTSGGVGIAAQSDTGPALYAAYVTAGGTSNGIGVAVNNARRACGVFQTELDSDSVAIAARANYALVAQQNDSVLGASILIKPNTNVSTGPTHSAEAGSVVARYIGSSRTDLYVQTEGGLNTAGDVWKPLHSGHFARLESAFNGAASNTTDQEFLTFNVPANSVAVGDTYLIECFGTQSQSAAANDLELSVFVGGSEVLRATVATGSSARTNRPWKGSAAIMFNAVGGSGTVVGGAWLEVPTEPPGAGTRVTGVTVNTTTTTAISVRIRNSTSNASNIARVRAATIRGD